MEKMSWGMDDMEVILENCTCTCKCGSSNPSGSLGDDPSVCKPSPWGVAKAMGIAGAVYC